MAAISISVGNINFDNTWLAIGEESIYVQTLGGASIEYQIHHDRIPPVLYTESHVVFTINLAERRNNSLLIDNIDVLRNAFRYVKQRKPFHIDAIVILPDHLHCIWTLPPDTAISL